ncbi:ATP-grasp ribosomal peptide maturase [Micromonospora sp. WMMA1363]|uniref:ATP-grasp ribosomal peptide maturase n=1 Tax=Micromonospora sp. WMMA1363 TaxID=3053985 RepID=UPI00259CE64A|nr:ATP-grasp ribosomal peptide maturase [Micromonospora sp. WMMA1363]MDM4719798.1 ATP-grasp ribosomal peptide maturase [Micromonospora sp. WMMA1363]MDM4721689.1 ATP-grasp ribosomal peptide maturase [Micromonospora sp. WMMA1363]
MGDERTVLVLTQPYDVTADYVVAELAARDVPIFRCDPGDFPRTLTLVAQSGGGWRGSLRLPGRRAALHDLGCAYYRRPTAFELPAHLTDEERRWATREARMGLGGVLAAHPLWLNHPHDIARAEYKPVQLAAAGTVGLSAPPTLITNEPAAAERFVREHGGAVVKPLGSGVIAEAGTAKLIYTNRVCAEEIDHTVAGTAHLFQQQVDKAYEVRLTVVDDAWFAVRIDGASQATGLDWRTDYDALSYSVVTVPEAIRAAVSRLLARLRLRFGALDFIVTPHDEWIFLEINPNGQWAWLQDATGLPIAAAIADALTKETT